VLSVILLKRDYAKALCLSPCRPPAGSAMSVLRGDQSAR